MNHSLTRLVAGEFDRGHARKVSYATSGVAVSCAHMNTEPSELTPTEAAVERTLRGWCANTLSAAAMASTGRCSFKLHAAMLFQSTNSNSNASATLCSSCECERRQREMRSEGCAFLHKAWLHVQIDCEAHRSHPKHQDKNIIN